MMLLAPMIANEELNYEPKKMRIKIYNNDVLNFIMGICVGMAIGIIASMYFLG